jgi:hypothetical protein
MRSETVAVGCQQLRIGLFERFLGRLICGQLPLVAPAGLHKCSIISAWTADGQRSFGRPAMCALRVEPFLLSRVRFHMDYY